MKVSSLVVSLLTIGFGTTALCQQLSLSPHFCESFSASAARSCGSFKELVDHKDRELLPALSGESVDVSYVCFDETDDRFVALSLALPRSGRGALSHDEYRSGMRESNHRHVDLKWYAPLGREDHTYPEGWWMPVENRAVGKYEAPDGTVSTVDASEVSLTYSYPNQSGGKTHYELTIRRSTNRFTEAWEPDNGRAIEQAGHCGGFRQTKTR